MKTRFDAWKIKARQLAADLELAAYKAGRTGRSLEQAPFHDLMAHVESLPDSVARSFCGNDAEADAETVSGS